MDCAAFIKEVDNPAEIFCPGLRRPGFDSVRHVELRQALNGLSQICLAITEVYAFGALELVAFAAKSLKVVKYIISSKVLRNYVIHLKMTIIGGPAAETSSIPLPDLLL